MDNALVIGATGQDGSYLCKILAENGYSVVGTSRDTSQERLWRLKRIGILGEIEVVEMNPKSEDDVARIIKGKEYRHIYNLSGLASVGQSLDEPREAIESIVTPSLNILNTIKSVNRDIRYIGAGSTEVFGGSSQYASNEESPHRPQSPYANAKSCSTEMARVYRDCYKLNCCTAIMSNHESILRDDRYVSMKIVSVAKEIKKAGTGHIKLGNIESERDWGWAADYMHALMLMAESKDSSDYVIATGESYSVRRFAEKVFEWFDLNLDEHLELEPSLMRPGENKKTITNPQKAYRELGWRAECRFDSVIDRLCSGSLY